MKAAPLILLGVTCLAAAVVAPGLPTDSHGAKPIRPALTAPSSSKAAPPERGAWGLDATLEREADGHFYADVSVDGTSRRMLVDTGASVVSLTGDDAQAMGIRWDAADVRPVGQGANGAVYGVTAMLDSVKVGDVELHSVPAMIVPEGLGISLLGQSFLGRLEHVEMGRDKMVLGT